jgi:Xaa-Pro aminopeptidase
MRPTAPPAGAPAGSRTGAGWWQGIRFDDAEYAERLARLREAMAVEELDALVLSDDRVTWWLTGFGDVAPMGSAARPRVLVLPREEEPAFFVHRSTLRCVLEMSAVGDVRGYEELGPAPVEEIAAFLADRRCVRAGLELGGQLRPAMTPGDVAALAARLPEAVDGSGAVWSVRTVKSEAELQRIRAACELTSRAYERGFRELRPGTTEREAAALLRRFLAEEGADGSWCWVVSGRGEYDRIDGVARNRAFEAGDLVFVDMGTNVGGYWADFSRACVLGRATPSMRRTQELVAETTEIGVRAIAPGRRTGEVARVVDEAMADRGLEFSSRAGRFGHGLGLAVTEPPDIRAGDPTPIVPGMVLTMEPGTWTEEGMFHCEQDVLVTGAGCEVLSSAPLSLTEV